ncbi:MAG: tetratricopeptide repeat protein [Candidatus Cyclobacteriaceae bacterium M2_1C_046]
MVAKKSKKSEEHTGQEYIENPEVLAEQFSRTEEYINKNKKLLIGIGAVVALLIAGYFGYRFYNQQQNEEAQTQMFQAVYYFEQDSLNLALQGDGMNPGFIDIADQYSGTEAGNLANYYAGAAYLKQGKYELATLYLQDYDANDLLVQARAYSLIGDAYMEMGEFENAAEYYDKAVNYKPNKFFTPQYLLKEALAHEKREAIEEAKTTYDQIIEEYPNSAEYFTAVKYKARLD